MIFINHDFVRGWNKDCRPEFSETFAIYSQENSVSEIVCKFLEGVSDEYCFLFRALGIPGIIKDIMSEFEGKTIYKPYDAHKLFIKRFPQLVCRFEKNQISTVLNQWTNSTCERRFIYCVHKDSVDFITSYFENATYTELSGGNELWNCLEFFVENIPEFEYVDSFSFTMRSQYLSKIMQISKAYQLNDDYSLF